MVYSGTTNKDLFAAEAKSLELLMQRAPQSLIRTIPVDPKQLYDYIGISGISDKPRGFIRFSPQDFIVEEIGLDGTVSNITPESSQPLTTSPGDKTIYADMVKIGLGTLDAVAQVAQQLHVDQRYIGYSGLKDGRAVTSQRISLRGVQLSALTNASWDQVFLKVTHTGKGALAAGQLQGNRFTMFVRTEYPINEETLREEVRAVQETGYPNLYGAQRFGNRLLNPLLGKLLCQGNFEEAVRVYLVQPGPFDIQIYKVIRERAAKDYGNWEKMMTQFDILPYRFRHERALLSALIQYDNNLVRALLALEEQVTFWIYGYASFLVNRFLSEAYMGEHDIPDPLPIPLGGGFADELYGSSLAKDGATNYKEHLIKLPFWRQKYRTLVPWIVPEVHSIATIPAGAALSFSLPRAAYATTFLMFLFQLYEGTPIPDWTSNDDVDAKAILHQGAIAETLRKFTYTDMGKEIALGKEISEE